jgi:hypothetical protein
MFTELANSDESYDSIPGAIIASGSAEKNESGRQEVDEVGYQSEGEIVRNGVSPELEVGFVHLQRPSLPWYVCIVWVMFAAISAAAPMVSIMFFTFLFPRMDDYPSIGLENLQVHLLNSVIVLLEHFLTAVPCRLLHMVYPIVYGCIYMVFSVVYWAGDHSRVMYPGILDWNKPGPTTGYVLVIGFVFIPLLHTVFFIIYKAKMIILRRYCLGHS